MAHLTTCYKVKTKFVQGSDRLDWKVWYFTKRDANIFPYHHLFGSGIDMDSRVPVSDWDAIGETAGPRILTDGKNHWGYKGLDCFVGEASWYETGVPQSALGPLDVPDCCHQPLNEVCGGLPPRLVLGCQMPEVSQCLDMHPTYIELLRDPDTGSWYGGGQLGNLPTHVWFAFSAKKLPPPTNAFTATLITVFDDPDIPGSTITKQCDCPFGEFATFDVSGGWHYGDGGCSGGTELEAPFLHLTVGIHPGPDPSWISSGKLHIASLTKKKPKYPFTSSGELTLTGIAFAASGSSVSSGGLSLGGDTEAAIGSPAFTSHGGLVLAGDSEAVYALTWVSIGGLVLSSTTHATGTYYVTGGFVLAGDSVAAPTYEYPSDGGLVLAGDSDAFQY